MLRHIRLAAAIVAMLALLALTAETVLARGGARGGRGSYNFGGTGYGYGYYRGTESSFSPHYRSSAGTSSSKSSGRSNAVAAEPTVATPIVPTRTLTSTTSTLSTVANAPSGSSTAKHAIATSSPSQAQPTTTTSPIGISPILSVPLSVNPDAAAQQTYGAMLHNAKQLIRAGIYGPAAQYLRRIINGAPGTRIAAEAQRLLAALPT